MYLINPYRFAAPIIGDWSPTDKHADITISADKVSLTTPDGAATARIGRGNTAWSSGNRYFEVTVTSGTAGLQIGVALSSVALTSTLGTNGDDSWGYRQNGSMWVASWNLGNGASYGAGDVIGVLYEGSAGLVRFYKNGVQQGTYSHTNLANKAYLPAGGMQGVDGANRVLVLDTHAPFAYLPAGATAWET